MFEYLELLDRNILLFINGHHSALSDKVIWQLSKSWHTIVLLLAACVVIFRYGSKKLGIYFVAGCIFLFSINDFVSNQVKHSVKRYRPSHNTDIKDLIYSVSNYKGGQYGFYSAHAANTFSVTAFAFLFIRQIKRNRNWWLFFLYPALVSYSRIYLGVHYPSDIIAGAIAGILSAWILFYLINTYFLKLNEKEH